MAHVSKNKALLTRARRIKGQAEGVVKLIENEADCSKVLQAITACRGAMNSLLFEVLQGHLYEHVLLDSNPLTADQAASAEELINVIKTYLK